MLNIEDRDTALHILQKAKSLSDNNAEIFYQMGVAWMRTGDDKKALENFHKAIEIDPKMDKAISQSGVIFAMSSQLEEAITYFKKAIAVFPSDYQNYKNLGFAYRDQKKYDLAIENLERSLEINPYSDVSFTLASILFNQKKYEQAKKYFLMSKKIGQDKNEDYWIGWCDKLLENE